MRTETFTDKKMVEILEKKDKLITEGRALTLDIEAMEKKRNKLGLKVQKLKDKMVSSVDEREFKLDEFEYLRSVELKDKDIEVTIGDAQDDWKEAYREQKKEAVES